MRETRTLRLTGRGLETAVMVRTEAPALSESCRQRLLPVPNANRASPRPYRDFHTNCYQK